MPTATPKPITPAVRQRLQKLWDEARSILSKDGVTQADAQKAHELLADCVASDPGNTVYLDALLVNLRQLSPKGSGIWSLLWGNPNVRGLAKAREQNEWAKVLELGPAALREEAKGKLTATLRTLAEACAECDFPQAELRYLQEALYLAPGDNATSRQLVRALLRQGRFDEARTALDKVCEIGADEETRVLYAILDGPLPDDSSVNSEHRRLQYLRRTLQEDPCNLDHYLVLADALVAARQFGEAETIVSQAQSMAGGNLRVRQAGEEVPLARLREQVEIARRLVAHEPTPAHQTTLSQWEAEQGRLEMATLHARSQRYPESARLKLELAIRLRRAGNYSGAIEQLTEARRDPELKSAILIELGECWQHLRQFDKALDLYLEAGEECRRRLTQSSAADQQSLLKLALYRAAVLAKGMGSPEQAESCLRELERIDPEFEKRAASLSVDRQ